jgi:hypothetical protein
MEYIMSGWSNKFLIGFYKLLAIVSFLGGILFGVVAMNVGDRQPLLVAGLAHIALAILIVLASFAMGLWIAKMSKPMFQKDFEDALEMPVSQIYATFAIWALKYPWFYYALISFVCAMPLLALGFGALARAERHYATPASDVSCQVLGAKVFQSNRSPKRTQIVLACPTMHGRKTLEIPLANNPESLPDDVILPTSKTALGSLVVDGRDIQF